MRPSSAWCRPSSRSPARTLARSRLKRAELAALPGRSAAHPGGLEAIRAAGDNTGSMALKGASPAHSGDALADRWALDEHLARLAERWSIDPGRDLGQR